MKWPSVRRTAPIYAALAVVVGSGIFAFLAYQSWVQRSYVARMSREPYRSTELHFSVVETWTPESGVDVPVVKVSGTVRQKGDDYLVIALRAQNLSNYELRAIPFKGPKSDSKLVVLASSDLWSPRWPDRQTPPLNGLILRPTESFEWTATVSHFPSGLDGVGYPTLNFPEWVFTPVSGEEVILKSRSPDELQRTDPASSRKM